MGANRLEYSWRTGWRGVLDQLGFLALRSFLRALGRLYFGFRVDGHVPAAGPVILAANHASFLDPLILGSSSRRRVRFVSTDLYNHNPFLHWFLRWNGAIFVREEGFNRNTILQVVEALKEGEVVGIFPEGSISTDGKLNSVAPGTLILARRSGAPIVPVAIRGSHAALRRGSWFPKPATIHVRIGAPLYLEDLIPAAGDRRSSLREGAKRLQQELTELLLD
ncbi:MAG: lysophospholipid acyltransferase family protein [Planctomycetota bacterium]